MIDGSLFQEGTILYLPAIEIMTPIEERVYYRCPPKEAFGHPVVVLNADQSADWANILIVTSRGGRAFESLPLAIQANYLPIHPVEPHPRTGVALHLHNHLSMDQPSLVKVSTAHSVPASALRDFGRGKRFILTGESHRVVVSHLDESALDLNTTMEVRPPSYRSLYPTINNRSGAADSRRLPQSPSYGTIFRNTGAGASRSRYAPCNTCTDPEASPQTRPLLPISEHRLRFTPPPRQTRSVFKGRQSSRSWFNKRISLPSAKTMSTILKLTTVILLFCGLSYGIFKILKVAIGVVQSIGHSITSTYKAITSFFQGVGHDIASAYHSFISIFQSIGNFLSTTGRGVKGALSSGKVALMALLRTMKAALAMGNR